MFHHAMGTLPARLLYLSVFLPVSSVKSSKQAKSSKLFRLGVLQNLGPDQYLRILSSFW